MNEAALQESLERFGGGDAERRAVARAARDLVDAGRFEDDTDVPLTADIIVDNLDDARSGGPAERWNWWLGSLAIAYDRGEADGAERSETEAGYRSFRVDRWSGDE